MEPFFWDAYEGVESVLAVRLGANDDGDTILYSPVFRRRGDDSCVYFEMTSKPRISDPPRLGYIMICYILRPITTTVVTPQQQLCYKCFGELVIIKVFEFAKVQSHFTGSELPFREIQASRMIQVGRHVATVDAVLQDQEGNIAMVMPLRQGQYQALDEYILQRGLPTLDDCLKIFRQLILGLDHIHSVGLCHRDISCENFVVTTTTTNHNEYYCYIIDLGLAIQVPRAANGQFLPVPSNGIRSGKTYYQSPEVYHSIVRSYNAEKADVWSCGIVLLNMLTGYLYLGTELAVYQWRQRGPTDVHANLDRLLGNVPELAANLVRNMLQLDVNQRFSIAQILRELNQT